MSGDGSVLEALSSELAQLENGAHFTAAELTPLGVTVWTVSRDAKGTPERPRFRTFTDLPDADPAALADFYASQLAPALGSRLVLIGYSADGHPAELLGMLGVRRRVPVYECLRPLKDYIQSAVSTAPLRDGYELVVLRELDGDLSMDLRLLIPQDATSGYITDFKIRCLPTDHQGTVFAVMIRDRGAGATPASPRPRPIELQSARLPPGEYNVSAELIRPGHVEFHGLPVPLEPETRRWQEIVRTVPRRLTKASPAHLVCLLEVSGSEQLKHRIDGLEELIDAIVADGRPLKVSLVTYGAHSVGRDMPEVAASLVAWAAPGDIAIRKLTELRTHSAPEREYLRAAQVECALAEVTRLFAGSNPRRDGRPVVVTAGNRPPHPERVDLHTEIIPCPRRVSWQRTLGSLSEALPDLKFGALCNAGAVGNVWTSLGRDAIEEVDGVMDVPAFAARLGLRNSPQTVPFPLI
jgi:hypothetical protein